MNSAENNLEIDDSALASGLKSGDDEALRTFMVTFGNRFRNLFIRSGLSETDAEDLAVDCATDIAMKIDQFDDHGPGSFQGWCFRIARNRLADQFRQRRVQTVPLEELTEEPVASPADSTDNSELQQVVRTGLASLKEMDREIITLRHFQSVGTFAEMGQILNISQEAARVRYYRAKKRLAGVLEPMPTVQRLRHKSKMRYRE